VPCELHGKPCYLLMAKFGTGSLQRGPWRTMHHPQCDRYTRVNVVLYIFIERSTVGFWPPNRACVSANCPSFDPGSAVDKQITLTE
jgi:hypothetical protein